MRWYAIHTKPRQEATVQAGLVREGIPTFYPKLRRKKMVRRKYQWITASLFPSYIFAQFNFAQSGRLVKYAQGVINIVSFGGRPAVVDESIILTILTNCQGDVVTVEPPQMKAGDHVQIQEGPFLGLRGIFERELNGTERVVILLESIGAGARVEIAKSQLEKV